MALGVCIPDLIQQGKLTGERAERAQMLYDELVLQYRRRFDQPTAESMATKSTIDALERDTLTRRRQVLLQAAAQGRIEKQARIVYDGGSGRDGPISGKALMAHLVRDERARGIANVEYRWASIKKRALGRMYALLEEHRPNMLGQVRNRAELDDVVRELHGKSTGSANAAEMAGAWRGTAEWLRQRFNAAGGDIGKLETWALPQHHDPALVGLLTADEWIGRVAPVLDRSRMIDRLTGEPLSDARLELVLREVYESIVTDGWNSRSPGAMANKATGNRHAEHRLLHFRDADDWIAYQNELGAGSAFDAMMGHIEMMARDIAAIEILGPNPAATIKWMQDIADKEAATQGRLIDRAAATIRGYEIDKVWNEIQGQNRRVVRRPLAMIGSSIRNWQTTTKLGSAALASMSDHATRAMVRMFNGLPVTDRMGQYLRQLNPMGEDGAFVRRAGFISDEFTGRMASHGRLHFEEAFGGHILNRGGSNFYEKMIGGLQSSTEVTRRLADGTLRASGLNAHTIAGREAMAAEFMNGFTSYAGRDFDALEPAFRRFLQRHGMGRDDWDAIRTSPTVQGKGIDWITPESIAQGRGGERLSDRVMEAMLQEIELAVPTGGIWMRAMVHSLPPGTVMGELVRTGFQFKMFPVTVIALHGGRFMAQQDAGKMAIYGTAFLASTTMMGALSYQMIEMAKGRDPRPMTDWGFWRAAMLKGGGAGIYGDIVEKGTSEYGQDLGDVTKGPGYGTIQRVLDGVSATVQRASADTADEVKKAQRAQSTAYRNLAREVPGNNIWYIRAAYERLLVDTIGRMADPDYDATIRRAERRAAETGQEFFLPPGGGAVPERAPDLANAFADAPE